MRIPCARRWVMGYTIWVDITIKYLDCTGDPLSWPSGYCNGQIIGYGQECLKEKDCLPCLTLFRAAVWSHNIITGESTVWCYSSMAIFVQNMCNRHIMAHLWGWGMGCLLWIQSLISVQHQSMHCFIQCLFQFNYFSTINPHSFDILKCIFL